MGDREGHPLEKFVQRKLSQDFTEAGRPRELVQARGGKSTALAVRHHPTDTYQKLMIPGKIFHVRKLMRESRSWSNGLGKGLSDGHGRAGRGRGRMPRRGKGRGEMKREADKLYWMERATPEEVSRAKTPCLRSLMLSVVGCGTRWFMGPPRDVKKCVVDPDT